MAQTTVKSEDFRLTLRNRKSRVIRCIWFLVRNKAQVFRKTENCFDVFVSVMAPFFSFGTGHKR